MEADSIPIYFSTNLRFLRKVNGFTQKMNLQYYSI